MVTTRQTMAVLVCIDGLPRSITCPELRTTAERYGEILRCWVVRDHRGQSLGFGYIEAPSSGQAEAVVNGLTGARFRGRLCRAAIVRPLEKALPASDMPSHS